MDQQTQAERYQGKHMCADGSKHFLMARKKRTALSSSSQTLLRASHLGKSHAQAHSATIKLQGMQLPRRNLYGF